MTGMEFSQNRLISLPRVRIYRGETFIIGGIVPAVFIHWEGGLSIWIPANFTNYVNYSGNFHADTPTYDEP